MARLPASATMITNVEPLAMMRPKDSLGSAVEPRRETHRSERERLAGARTAGVSRAVSCRLLQTRTRSQRLARGMNGVTMRDGSTDGRLFTDRFHMKLPGRLGPCVGRACVDPMHNEKRDCAAGNVARRHGGWYFSSRPRGGCAWLNLPPPSSLV